MKKFLLIIIFILTPSILNALSLPQYLDLLIENDLEYKKLKFEAKKIEGQLKAANGMFDIQLVSDISNSQIEEINQGALKIENNKIASFEVSLQKLVKLSGTTISLGYGNESNNMTAMNLKIEQYQPYAYLTISQPLLKNQFGKMNKNNIRSIELLLETQKLLDKENEESYFAARIEEYYNWLSLTLGVKVTRENHKNTLSLHKEMKEKYKNDLVHKTDLLRSEEALFSVEETLANQINTWEQISKPLAQSLGIKLDLEKSIQIAANLPINQNIPSDFLKTSNNRLNEIYRLRLRILELEKESIESENQLQLDMVANYKIYDYKTTQSYWETSKNDYTIGLTSKLDLEGKPLIGKLQEINAKISELKTQKQKAIADRHTLLTTIGISIKTNKNSQERWNKISNLSRQRVKLEKKRYNSGKVPFNNVVTAQNDKLINENSNILAKINGTILLIKKLAVNDQLLSLVNIKRKRK